jgi:hypothetical protein
VLEMLATDDPGKLPQIGYGLLPRDAKGAELGPVLETIENALRADQAKLIEAE